MVPTEQPIIDREAPRLRLDVEIDRAAADRRAASGVAERAARESLRAQVAKLERELSGVVAERFPYVSPGSDSHPARSAGHPGPHLLSLAELERLRDRLVARLRGAQRVAGQRSELETRSRELLERMKQEPGRYKFVRLPVTDLGERGCGVWEVRPRLGLIGMLAGWWQLTLSSGCPLPRPRAPGARPLPVRGSAAPPAFEARVAPPHDTLLPRASAGGLFRRGRSSAERDRALLVARRGERATLALGQRPHGLGLRELQLVEQFAAAALSPSALADQQVRHRHAVGLPGALEDDVGSVELPRRHPPLELGAG